MKVVVVMSFLNVQILMENLVVNNLLKFQV